MDFRLAVLVHHGHGFSGLGYLLEELGTVWRDRGIRLTVIQGPRDRIEADALFLHVDLTKIPVDYISFIEQQSIVINRHVTDISKRLVSRNIVNAPGGHDGPVIVKTDANCGGFETPPSLEPVRRYRESIRGRIPSPWSRKSLLRKYRVYDSPESVPAGVWKNPNLVVERFRPERSNGSYCLRTWLFLGDQERIARFYSHSPVVKSTNIIGRDVLTDVPSDLREMRRALGFDYGKFDFAVVDGETVLYDTNRTPTIGSIPREQYYPWLGKLADGLGTFLPAATA